MTSGRSLLLGLLAAGWLVGCARITPHAGTTEVSTVQLRPGDYDRLDYVRGEDCVGRYAIFFRLYSPNVASAAADALKKAPGANFLMNRHVSMEERFTVPLLYHRLCAIVEGRAVRLHTAAEVTP